MDGFSDQLRKRTVTESQIVRANMQELKSPSEVMNVCSSYSDSVPQIDLPIKLSLQQPKLKRYCESQYH